MSEWRAVMSHDRAGKDICGPTDHFQQFWNSYGRQRVKPVGCISSRTQTNLNLRIMKTTKLPHSPGQLLVWIRDASVLSTLCAVAWWRRRKTNDENKILKLKNSNKNYSSTNQSLFPQFGLSKFGWLLCVGVWTTGCYPALVRRQIYSRMTCIHQGHYLISCIPGHRW